MRYGYGRRATVEETDRVDADVTALLVSLEPICGEQRIGQYRASIKPQRARLGGHRWFWVCPRCGSLRKRLYRSNAGGWACRVCLGLTYRSAQSNHRPGKFWGMIATGMGCSGRAAMKGLAADARGEDSRIRRNWWRCYKRRTRKLKLG